MGVRINRQMIQGNEIEIERKCNHNGNSPKEFTNLVLYSTPHNDTTIVVSFCGMITRLLCSIQLISMVLVTAHSTAMPFLAKEANRTNFLPTTSVFMMEVLKLVFCSIILIFKTGNVKKTAQKLHTTIWKNKLETLAVAVPAIFYAIQNNLYYVALANIDPTTYSITLQLRILTTAVLSLAILSKQLSFYQWGAQVVALLGVVIVQIDKDESIDETTGGSFLIGVSAVIGMCWTSSFAGVYFEKMLKNSSVDVWTQNIRLSLLTLFFAGITMITTNQADILQGRFFYGWSLIVWLVTILNSIGGLTVSLVMKYADNVMKTYCQSIAIGLIAIVAIFMGERPLTTHLIGGVLLVMASVVVYSLFPATASISSSYQRLEDKYDVENAQISSKSSEK